MKTCAKCKLSRPLDDFHNDKRHADGKNVWCKACKHEVEPDPAALARTYGAYVAVPDWRARLVCSKCGSRDIDMVVTGERR